MIYECKSIEPHGSRWLKAKAFFGIKPKVDGAKLLQEMIVTNNDSEFGENTKISKSLANLNGSSDLPAMPTDLISEEERNALLAFDDSEDSNTEEEPHIKKLIELEEKTIQSPAINNEKLRVVLINAISHHNYEELNRDQALIGQAIDELEREPFSENLTNPNYIKIYPKDMRGEYLKILSAPDISKTDEHFRWKLIELLESLLK